MNVTNTLKYITIVLLFLISSRPAEAVVATKTAIKSTALNLQTKKSRKKFRKAKRKITWKKVLKHGLLSLLQILSLVIALGGLTGSALIGLLFFNAAMLLAYIIMRRKKEKMFKESVLISCITIVINLIAIAFAYTKVT